ncbi:type VII secretion protein EccB [Microbacterium marinilacus]|uniref:Type VII secretion protein EccB n=1 Tax=Microbacterium marinilacus TaxID=415209 RepID=A0ABP7BFY0_9MICO|nr:type VII secretion protein EccB [Microbacterium marinilacus]MBY0689509.1 type VII secretion protein EccB [Microbacterium marinilacus]
MASKQELIQAQVFSRRRLLTAFTSGAPGGRELAPAKPLRGVLLSIGLAIVTAVVAMLIGTFSGTLPAGWEKASIVVVQGEGTRYAVVGSTLYPVKNLASARLITATTEVLEAPAARLEGMPRDATPRGIDGAPDALPAPDRLIGGAWTSCVAPETEGATATRVSTQAVPPREALATLVRAGDDRYFYVTGDTRYEVVPEDIGPIANVLLQVDDPAAAPVAPAAWLNLVDEGSALRPLALEGAGDAAPGAAGSAGLQIGQLVQTTAGGEATGQYVVSTRGRLVPVDDFSRALLDAFVDSALVAEPTSITAAEASPLIDTDSALIPSDWPTALAPSAGTDASCVRMEPTEDGPVVTVSRTPDSLGPGAQVDPGAGVAVAAEGTGGGRTYGFISENGLFFPVTTAEDLALLGYAEETLTAVPPAWVTLFETGPELNRGLALGAIVPES